MERALLLHPRPRVDRLRFDLAMLDLTALGRQEDWEESPAADPHTVARFELTHEN